MVVAFRTDIIVMKQINYPRIGLFQNIISNTTEVHNFEKSKLNG